MILVIGGGIFGVTAALELRARGEDVTLVDAGPIPNPLAESTDISKAVRMDYGADEDYVAHMERALEGWREWNARWKEKLFHECGVTFLTSKMEPGTFERASFELLRKRGHAIERLDERSIAKRFPAWAGSPMVDGYFNPKGGFAESGRVVARCLEEARANGVVIRENTRIERLEGIEADSIVVANGAWAPRLVPELGPVMRDAGQPVFHLRPTDPSPFARERFPVFGADIAGTGWYGFPLHEGVVKIANHGVGRAVHPDSPRDVPEDEERALRSFLERTLPMLKAAPIVFRRTCIYGDTRDEHFWIARDPARPHVTVATGGSGHAFKFAPLLGRWIANATLGIADPDLAKFRWRPDISARSGEEAARHHGGANS
jgi:glycine/D-amino acid oxidase-like deaminating enzyme